MKEKKDGGETAEDKGELPHGTKGSRAPCSSGPNAIYWEKHQRDGQK